jgi:hypothetical protein
MPPLTSSLDGRGDIVLYFRMSNNLTGVSYAINESTNGTTWTNTGLQGTLVSNMGSYDLMKVAVPIGSNKGMLLELTISSP